MTQAAVPSRTVILTVDDDPGVRRVLGARGGFIGALGVLLDQPALQGVSVSLSPAPGGARVRVHTVLDPSRWSWPTTGCRR